MKTPIIIYTVRLLNVFMKITISNRQFIANQPFNGPFWIAILKPEDKSMFPFAHFTLPCLISCVNILILTTQRDDRDGAGQPWCSFFGGSLGTPTTRSLEPWSSIPVGWHGMTEWPMAPWKPGPTTGEASELRGPQQPLLPESGPRERWWAGDSPLFPVEFSSIPGGYDIIQIEPAEKI